MGDWGSIAYNHMKWNAIVVDVAVPYQSKELSDRRKAANCWIYLSKIDVITVR